MQGDADTLSVTYLADDTRIAAGTGMGDIRLWDAGTGAAIGAPVDAHGSDDVWELVGAPEGERLLSASSDGTAKVWSLASGDQVGPPIAGAAKGERIAGVLWSSDGESILGGGDDGRLRRWDARTGAQFAVSAIGHDDRVIDVAGSADGTHVVSLGRDQDVRLWSIATPVPADPVLADLGEPLHGIAVSPDGRYLASGGDGVVHVIARDGTRVGEVTTAPGPVFALAFPNDRTLAVGDSRGRCGCGALPVEERWPGPPSPSASRPTTGPSPRSRSSRGPGDWSASLTTVCSGGGVASGDGLSSMPSLSRTAPIPTS